MLQNCINLSCMWYGCRRADPVVSQAYPGMPRYALAFVHLGQLSPLLNLGNRSFGKNDIIVASSNYRLRGGKTSMIGIQQICQDDGWLVVGYM